jgi:hypothetical protein
MPTFVAKCLPLCPACLWKLLLAPLLIYLSSQRVLASRPPPFIARLPEQPLAWLDLDPLLSLPPLPAS